MALAFPKTNGAIFAPLGAAALFYAWYGLAPMRAFWVGWVAGFVFFAITFRWFGETVGAIIAPFGFVVTCGPALGDAFFGFALPGALVAIVARALESRDRLSRALVPLGASAVFATGEWLRSEGLGPLGVPFGSLGFTQATSVLAPLASFIGTYGVTFVVCAIGAYVAYAIRMRAVRGSGMDTLVAAAVIALVTAEVMNAQMEAQGMAGAWAPGTMVTVAVIPAGTQFPQIINPEDEPDIMDGLNRFGAWGSPPGSDHAPSQQFARPEEPRPDSRLGGAQHVSNLNA